MRSFRLFAREKVPCLILFCIVGLLLFSIVSLWYVVTEDYGDPTQSAKGEVTRFEILLMSVFIRLGRYTVAGTTTAGIQVTVCPPLRVLYRFQ